MKREYILYIAFGVLTTGVNWCIYLLLCEMLCFNMLLSNAVAWSGAVLFAFVTNKLFVFESKCLTIPVLICEGLRFFGTRMFSGILEICLPSFFYLLGFRQSLFGIDGFWAKFLVGIIVILLNYVLSKKIVFHKK